ncbi:MAG: Ig-like domain-containing protein, partial [Acidimicrobiia bacterium]
MALLFGATTFVLLPTVAPVAQATTVQAAVEDFTLTTVDGGGTLQLRGFEPHEMETPTTLTGSLDTETGIITDGVFSTPTVSIQQEITDPVEATVFIDAVFSGAAPATGSVDPQGQVVIEAPMTVDLHVEVGDPPFLVNDCQASPIDLSLQSTAPYDPETGRVTLADSDFLVPEVQVAPTCGSTVASAINEQLAGGGHALSLDVEGDLTLPSSEAEPSTTALTVDPQGVSRLADPVTLTATVEPGDGAEGGPVPTGFVEFRDGLEALGTVPLSEVSGAGVAEFSTSPLGAGEHTLTARYRGDSVYAGSVSAEVSHTVAIAPIVNVAGLPEHIEYRAGPTEFDLAVINPGGGAPVKNARVNVSFSREVGGASLTPPTVSLEALDVTGVWRQVTLLQGPNFQTLVGYIDPATGFELPAGGTHSQRLRLAFPDVGGTPHPTACNRDNPTCPGPIRVTFEVVAVDPTSGEEVASLATTDGVVTLVEAERRAPVMNLVDGGATPHTLRQGNTTHVIVRVDGGRGGIDPTGCVSAFLDGVPIPVRSTGTPVEDGYLPCLPTRFVFFEVLLPPDTATGPRQLTFKYPGDALFTPAQVSTEITVLPGVGAPYECIRPGGTFGENRLGAGLVSQANLPSAVTAGSEIDLDHFDVRVQSARLRDGVPTEPLFQFPEGFVVDIGIGPLDGIAFEFGPTGGGTAAALQRTGSTPLPSTPYPAPETEVDQMLEFHQPTGSVVVNGAPGEVVPVTFDSLVVDYHLLGPTPVPFRLTCTPVGDPVVLGEVTVAGTTLSVEPAGPVPAGTEVTLTANTFPADAPGLVVFRDGDQDIGVVPVVDGQATMTTDSLPAGTRSLTARFFGGLTVPSTVSDPVALEVVAPQVDLAPATGLLEGQPMDVTVSNLIPGVSYELATCRGDECAAGQPATATPDGTIATTLPAVQRVTSTSGSHLVCRADCEVVLTGPGAAEGRATFAMAEGTLTVTPDEQLVDGQAVQVTGSELMPTYEGPLVAGVLPTGQWQVLQCDRQILDHPHLFGVWAFCA